MIIITFSNNFRNVGSPNAKRRFHLDGTFWKKMLTGFKKHYFCKKNCWFSLSKRCLSSSPGLEHKTFWLQGWNIDHCASLRIAFTNISSTTLSELTKLMFNVVYASTSKSAQTLILCDSKTFFKKMGQTRPLFVYFRSFHNTMTYIAQIWL